MKKLNFIFLYLIIFQPYFANSEEEISLKCTGQLKHRQIIGGSYDADSVIGVIYDKKLKKITFDGFLIGGSDDGCEGFRFPFSTDENDQEVYSDPFYCDKENFTYSMCFDIPSKPELKCRYRRKVNSELKRSISLSLDKVTGELFTWDSRKLTEDGQLRTFTGNCEKVDKLF